MTLLMGKIGELFEIVVQNAKATARFSVWNEKNFSFITLHSEYTFSAKRPRFGIFQNFFSLRHMKFLSDP